jgi:AcrR family transcriptional regulator
MAIDKMSTRELRKTERRRLILDAARTLILDGKERDFSMPALAEKAGVSLVTPYNLFGSKSGILVEIVREDIFERIKAIAELEATSAAGWASELACLLARVYYRNRHFYRRMIVSLVAQESAEGQRAALEFSYAMFTLPLKRLQERGVISAVVPAEIIARHLAHSVSGSLQHRLMERGSEALLRQEIETGLLLVLAGISTDDERGAMLARIRVLAEADPDESKPLDP